MTMETKVKAKYTLNLSVRFKTLTSFTMFDKGGTFLYNDFQWREDDNKCFKSLI